MSDNGNAAQALREAARRPVYWELKFADFDPSLEGSVKVRVSLTHAENKWAVSLNERLTVKAAQWRETPNDEEHRPEREALEKELAALADDSLAFTGLLLGMSREETLSYFGDEDGDANPVFKQWIRDSVPRMVQEFRTQDFLARRTRSAVGLIH